MNATNHANDLWVYILGDDTPLGGDVLKHLVKRLGFDLLALEFRTGVVEVEQDATLVELLDEEAGTLARRGL